MGLDRQTSSAHPRMHPSHATHERSDDHVTTWGEPLYAQSFSTTEVNNAKYAKVVPISAEPADVMTMSQTQHGKGISVQALVFGGN